VQQIDAITGLPIGAPVAAPDSQGIGNNSFGTALACAATCRLVYGDAPTGSSTNRLVSWWIGQAAPAQIANFAGSGETAGRVVADAYRSDGRLWIAWWDGKSYSYTLGDATGAGGTVEDAGIPSAAPTGAYALTASPVGDNLLLATTYTSKSGQNSFAVYVNDEGAVLHGRRQPRRQHPAARVADDVLRPAADGARRPHRRVDRPHQVRCAAGACGDPLAPRRAAVVAWSG
jgi:hypothetical protein